MPSRLADEQGNAMGRDHPKVHVTERRVRDRRVTQLPFDGPDRRVGERRSGRDRRKSVRDESVRFSHDEGEVQNYHGSVWCERRCSARKPLETTLNIRDTKGVLAEGCVLDLSQTGCQVTIKSGHSLRTGRTYSLRLGGMDLSTGCVIWSAYGKLGVEFLRPLYAPVMEDLVRRFPPIRAFPGEGRLTQKLPMQLFD